MIESRNYNVTFVTDSVVIITTVTVYGAEDREQAAIEEATWSLSTHEGIPKALLMSANEITAEEAS